MKFAYDYHSHSLKFSPMSPLNQTKFIMLMGESWNLKAFLSLITDDLKYDYIPPSSILLMEAYSDGSIELSVNDHKIT